MSLSSAGTFLRIQVCGRPKLWVVRAGNRELRVVPSWPPEMAEGPAGNDQDVFRIKPKPGRLWKNWSRCWVWEHECAPVSWGLLREALKHVLKSSA